MSSLKWSLIHEGSKRYNGRAVAFALAVVSEGSIFRVGWLCLTEMHRSHLRAESRFVRKRKRACNHMNKLFYHGGRSISHGDNPQYRSGLALAPKHRRTGTMLCSADGAFPLLDRLFLLRPVSKMSSVSAANADDKGKASVSASVGAALLSMIDSLEDLILSPAKKCDEEEDRTASIKRKIELISSKSSDDVQVNLMRRSVHRATNPTDSESRVYHSSGKGCVGRSKFFENCPHPAEMTNAGKHQNRHRPIPCKVCNSDSDNETDSDSVSDNEKENDDKNCQCV